MRIVPSSGSPKDLPPRLLPSAVLLLSGTILWALGCHSPSSEGGPPRGSEPAASSTAGPPGQTDQEIWEVHEIGGVRVGYARTSIRRESEAGHPVLRFVGLSRIALKRAGEPVQMAIRSTSLETPDGQLRRFELEVSQGPLVIKTRGRVVGDRLELDLTAQGKTVTSTLAWSDEYGGLYAADLSLARKPMKPGEKRTLQALVPAANKLGSLQLTARDFEPVQLPGGTRQLLRIDTRTTLPDGLRFQGTLWADRTGEILKEHDQTMNVVTYRATREIALEASEIARYDLVTQLAVPLDRRLEQPYQTRRVRYRIRLDGRNPAEALAVGPSQAIRPIDERTAEVTVYSVRPDRPGNPRAPEDPPTDGDRAANGIIQSDDPRIVALAEEAVGDQTDPWALAVAMERFVHSYISSTDYSQAFATAADVARTRVGDCTEHAVLLAALARARKIPARVAIGLIYTEETGKPALGYHMWNELYIQDRWIPLDATLARGGAGAARLKLSHSNLEGASALSCFLPVCQVAGRLDVEILDVQ